MQGVRRWVYQSFFPAEITAYWCWKLHWWAQGKWTKTVKSVQPKQWAEKKRSSIQLEELQSCMIIIRELITTSYPFHVHVVISTSPSDSVKILIIATLSTVCSASVMWIILPYYHANRTPHAETKKRKKNPPKSSEFQHAFVELQSTQTSTNPLMGSKAHTQHMETKKCTAVKPKKYLLLCSA